MSTSKQHDNASEKQKYETLEEWVNESPDHVTKRIRSLHYIAKVPHPKELSDEALFLYGKAANSFFHRLGTRSVTVKDIGIDEYDRIILKTEYTKSYQDEIQRAVQMADARDEVLLSMCIIVVHVSTLPGIHSCLGSVLDLASYAQSGVDNGVDGMDFDTLEEKCCAAYELLSPRVSEIGEAMRCLDPGSWCDPPLDSDIRKSTEVLRDAVELFQLSAFEVEELERLMQDLQPSLTVCDRLRYGFYSLEELEEVIEHLQNDISFYRERLQLAFNPSPSTQK